MGNSCIFDSIILELIRIVDAIQINMFALNGQFCFNLTQKNFLRNFLEFSWVKFFLFPIGDFCLKTENMRLQILKLQIVSTK